MATSGWISLSCRDMVASDQYTGRVFAIVSARVVTGGQFDSAKDPYTCRCYARTLDIH